MKEITRYGFILGLICVIASTSLAAVNALTKSRIITQAQAEEEASLKDVLPQASRFEPVSSEKGEILYYKGYGNNGKLIAVAFKASAKGYSSIIETIAGMTLDGVITDIKVISQNETPGLGMRVAEKAFTKQFNNKSIKELDGVDVIAGATISSRTVINSVRDKAEKIKELLRNGK